MQHTTYNKTRINHKKNIKYKTYNIQRITKQFTIKMFINQTKQE